jgi:hypothetical protein
VKIPPSSLFASDGSENEGYRTILAEALGAPAEFTGGDLAKLRAAYIEATGGK